MVMTTVIDAFDESDDNVDDDQTLLLNAIYRCGGRFGIFWRFINELEFTSTQYVSEALPRFIERMYNHVEGLRFISLPRFIDLNEPSPDNIDAAAGQVQELISAGADVCYKFAAPNQIKKLYGINKLSGNILVAVIGSGHDLVVEHVLKANAGSDAMGY